MKEVGEHTKKESSGNSSTLVGRGGVGSKGRNGERGGGKRSHWCQNDPLSPPLGAAAAAAAAAAFFAPDLLTFMKSDVQHLLENCMGSSLWQPCLIVDDDDGRPLFANPSS